MQLYGNLAGETVVLTDRNHGVPIFLAEEPVAAPGYVTHSTWTQKADGIYQVWKLEPAAGTIAQATYELARMMADELTDAQALRVPALYEEWTVPAHYKEGIRLVYNGVLYKVLMEHDSQPTWTPDVAASVYARVLAEGTGDTPEWVQPESTEGYSKGQRVTKDGKVWESLVNDNIWMPGEVGTEQVWREVVDISPGTGGDEEQEAEPGDGEE